MKYIQQINLRGIDLIATSDRINYHINRCGLKQAHIAHLLGLSPQSVDRWCSGKALPTLDNFVDLCDILRCSIDSLVVRNESISIPPVVKDSSGDAKDSYTLIRYIGRVGKQQ